MIRIVKPAMPPKILTTRGNKQTQTDCVAYDNSSADYRSGAKKFNLDTTIYGAKSVKNTLLRAQYNKCCYCESRFRHTSYGAVEHYRPKGTVKQALGQAEEYPGYYWLVYDWNNLLASCEVCNTSYKGNVFPLLDNRVRARSHHDSIEVERPLFINPAIENPQDHIYFRGASPEPLTEVGRATIHGLGLRRPDLEENRMQRLAELSRLRDFIDWAKDLADPNAQTLVKQAQAHLAAAIRPEAEYSAMARDFLDSNM